MLLAADITGAASSSDLADRLARETIARSEDEAAPVCQRPAAWDTLPVVIESPLN